MDIAWAGEVSPYPFEEKNIWRRKLDDAATNVNLFQMNHTGDIKVEKYCLWRWDYWGYGVWILMRCKFD